MGIVKWGNVWQQMGAACGNKYTDEIAKNADGASLFDDPDEKWKVLKMMEQAFLQINREKRMAYVKGNEEFIAFYSSFTEAQARITNPERKADELAEMSGKLNKKIKPIIKEDGTGAVLFFNPNAGIEIYNDFAKFIADPDNSYFNPQKEYALEDIVVEKTFSKEFINYLLDNKLIMLSSSGDSTMETSVILDNLDFLLRYYRRGRYWSGPNITFSQGSQIQ
jgi:hypothetical protein